MEIQCQKEQRKYEAQIEHAKQGAEKELILTYGFVADPLNSITVNATRQLLRLPAWLYFSRPQHTAFHDLTNHKKLPTNLRSLLGLGLNFCLREKHLIGHKAIDYNCSLKFFSQKSFLQRTTMKFLNSSFVASGNHLPNQYQLK